MAAIADQLGLIGLKKLRFEGQITPTGKTDWTLQGTLGATVTQPCAITLEPMNTRIDTPVSRHYVADYEEPSAPEVEMPEDDTVEPLPETISLSAVMLEALDLALPLFPRAEGVEMGDVRVTEPGKVAMTDDDAKPFAGLAALRDQLDQGSE